MRPGWFSLQKGHRQSFLSFCTWKGVVVRRLFLSRRHGEVCSMFKVLTYSWMPKTGLNENPQKLHRCFSPVINFLVRIQNTRDLYWNLVKNFLVLVQTFRLQKNRWKWNRETQLSAYTIWWFQPHLKNMSQIASFPKKVGLKIKNLWNYHLVCILSILMFFLHSCLIIILISLDQTWGPLPSPTASKKCLQCGLFAQPTPTACETFLHGRKGFLIGVVDCLRVAKNDGFQRSSSGVIASFLGRYGSYIISFKNSLISFRVWVGFC